MIHLTILMLLLSAIVLDSGIYRFDNWYHLIEVWLSRCLSLVNAACIKGVQGFSLAFLISWPASPAPTIWQQCDIRSNLNDIWHKCSWRNYEKSSWNMHWNWMFLFLYLDYILRFFFLSVLTALHVSHAAFFLFNTGTLFFGTHSCTTISRCSRKNSQNSWAVLDNIWLKSTVDNFCHILSEVA